MHSNMHPCARAHATLLTRCTTTQPPVLTPVHTTKSAATTIPPHKAATAMPNTSSDGNTPHKQRRCIHAHTPVVGRDIRQLVHAVAVGTGSHLVRRTVDVQPRGRHRVLHDVVQLQHRRAHAVVVGKQVEVPHDLPRTHRHAHAQTCSRTDMHMHMHTHTQNQRDDAARVLSTHAPARRATSSWARRQGSTAPPATTPRGSASLSRARTWSAAASCR